MPATEEEEKMLAYLKALGVPPMKDLEDMKRYMEGYGSKTTRTQLNPPRISIFFGEDGKGEASYPTWAYEVRSLRNEGIYPEEILLQSIRRSLRGHAADELRYIGEKPTIENILDYFDSTYGVVDTPESILQKFFACKQDSQESVLSFCSRLEDIHAKAVDMKALDIKDGMIKRVFYRGLTPQLKHLAAFKYETVPDFRNFKKEVRLIENEVQDDNTRDQTPIKTTKCSSINQNEEKKESKTEQQMSSLISMVEQLNKRIDTLENEKTNAGNRQQEQPDGSYYENVTPTYQQQISYQPGYNYRGRRQLRGPRGYRPRGQGPFRGQGRGDNSYQCTRPIAGNNFGPECYVCHQKGHIARDCTQYQPECYSCHQFGHYARNCPLNM